MIRTILPRYCLPLLGFILIESNLFGEDNPEDKLKETIEAVIDVLYQADGNVTIEEKRDKVLAVLDRSFSFDVLVRRTLGRNWRKLDERQQQEIVRLATDLMIYSYTREFTTGERPRVDFKKPLELAKNKIEISSVFSLSDTKINVAYRLARLESGWQVYDLIVEGISMVSNYRKQFDAHFLKGNGDELIDHLETTLIDL